MKNSLNAETCAKIMAPLTIANSQFAQRYSRESGLRQPVHTVYGGAHLFTAQTPKKLGALALRSFEKYAQSGEEIALLFGLESKLAEQIHARIIDKLTREPIEDFRIDFEDGYGYRSDDEEDQHAQTTAAQVALAMEQNSLPPFFGIRIKALNREMMARSIRTLDLFLTALLEQSNGALPPNFVITLPKVVSAAQVAALHALCSQLESQLGIVSGTLKVELMIETTQALCNEFGVNQIPAFIQEANGRCAAIHFGAFDYTASCGIAGEHQDIRHTACDFARQMMLIATAGTSIWLADGVTTHLPLEPHRGADLSGTQLAENQAAIAHAWKIHYDNIRHSLASGFYQSWDLHPAQLVPRYGATYAFFLEGLTLTAKRLRNFIEKAAQATTVGSTFDDAASAQGLLNYFLRAINCDALHMNEVEHLTGLSLTELRSGSFSAIMQMRNH